MSAGPVGRTKARSKDSIVHVGPDDLHFRRFRAITRVPGFPTVAVFLLMLSVGAVVFSPIWHIGFVQEDYSRLYEAKRSTFVGVWDSFVRPAPGFYRPLVNVWFHVLTRLWPYQVQLFHLGALLILSGAGAIIFKIARELRVGTGPAIIGAAFYSWNASLLSVVAWPSAISSALVALFVLIVLRVSLRPGIWYRSLGVLAFAAALCSKESAVTTPILALVLSMAHIVQGSARRATLVPKVRSALRVAFKRSAPLLPPWCAYVAFQLWRGATVQSGYQLHISTGVFHNFLHLAILSLGLSSGAIARIGSGGTAVIATAAWIALLSLSARTFRCGNYAAVSGVVLFVVGCFPVVLLTGHAIDGYYIDVCALGVALSVAGCVEFMWTRRAGPGALIAGMVAVMGFMAWSVRADVSTSAVVYQANRGMALLSEIERAIPEDLPRGMAIVLRQVPPSDQWALSFGDALRVALQDPHLQVVFQPSVVLGPPLRSGSKACTFIERGGILRPISHCLPLHAQMGANAARSGD